MTVKAPAHLIGMLVRANMKATTAPADSCVRLPQELTKGHP